MSTLNINRAAAVAIPFRVYDEKAGLAGKRVTWALRRTPGSPAVLVKQSDLGASSAEVLIASNDGTEMLGAIYLTVEDFATLPDPSYNATLWVDSGANDDICVTPGGADLVVIVPNVAREAAP